MLWLNLTWGGGKVYRSLFLSNLPTDLRYKKYIKRSISNINHIISAVFFYRPYIPSPSQHVVLHMEVGREGRNLPFLPSCAVVAGRGQIRSMKIKPEGLTISGA